MGLYSRIASAQASGMASGILSATSFLIVVVWRSGVCTMMPPSRALTMAPCAGGGALFAVGVDAFQVIDPFVLAAHGVEPLAAAADAQDS